VSVPDRAAKDRARRLAALWACCAALPGLALLWGFTVDDALISTRVAVHIKAGLGYRFNAAGPVTDAVTPLGFAYVLALLPGDSSLELWGGARWLGAAAYLSTAARLGYELGTLGNRGRYVGLIAIACCVPAAAWAGAGMETPLVALMATLAVFARGNALPALSGLVGAWRPELLGWALVLSVVFAFGEREKGGDAARERVLRLLPALALAAGPAVFVAVVRAVAFGDPAPLAVWAKPSDLVHGLRYAGGALVLSGAPWLLVSFRGYRRLASRERAIAAATFTALATLVAAGGDWMPFFRLLVPLLPSVVWLGARLAELDRPFVAWLRVGAVCASSLALGVGLGPAARGVAAQRTSLVDSARPYLGKRSAVATLDVGWVGAATDATVIDLAGVTDPAIAVLGGGHTSKRVPWSLLNARDIDTLVLLSGAYASDSGLPAFARAVENSLVRTAPSTIVQRAVLPLAGTRQSYFVLHVDGTP